MKKILLAAPAFGVIAFAALFLAALGSCKKGGSSSSNNTSYHLTAHIDGTTQNFNYTLQATKISGAGVYQFAITGYTGAPSAGGQGLGLGWTNTSAGPVFGIADWYDTSHAYSISGVYLPTSTDSWEAGTNVFFAGNGASIVNHLKLNISAFDSSTVTGTFSGDFYDMGLVSSTKKTIYGDFYVQRK